MTDARTQPPAQAAPEGALSGPRIDSAGLDGASTSIPVTPEGAGDVEGATVDRCGDCEWTPFGYFAYPCAAHRCEACGHVRHSVGDCPQPDPRTGWCECAAGEADEADEDAA